LFASFLGLLIISTVHFPFFVAKLNCIAVVICGMLDRELA
jgi:hypothetical protein